MLFMALIGAAATASTASAERSWKVYDVRDLIGLVPPPPPSKAELCAKQAAIASIGGGQSIFGAITAPKLDPKRSPAESVDAMMKRLCDEMGVVYAVLFSGVYGIVAEETEHATLQVMLESVRGLYVGRYAVELLWYTVAPDQTPTIGDVVQPAEATHRHRLVATRRTLVELVEVTQHTILAGQGPVVAQSAVGYQPSTESVESGLRLSLIVGADKETDATTTILVAGDLRRVVPDRMSGKLLGAMTQNIGIELPEIRVRSIHSNIRIEFGKLTALSVLDGFDEGGCIVVSASVQKLSD
jgi:hypothetical protein